MPMGTARGQVPALLPPTQGFPQFLQFLQAEEG